jgi:hypothetical protein
MARPELQPVRCSGLLASLSHTFPYPIEQDELLTLLYRHTVCLEFHQPGWINEATNRNKGPSRLDRHEHLAMRTSRFRPTRDVRQHHLRADHVFERQARISDDLADDH